MSRHFSPVTFYSVLLLFTPQTASKITSNLRFSVLFNRHWINSVNAFIVTFVTNFIVTFVTNKQTNEQKQNKKRNKKERKNEKGKQNKNTTGT